MKKVLFMLTLLISVITTASAQTALQTAKTFDNVSVGVTVGATTPLTFNSMFPVNTVIGLKAEKAFTPSVSLQVEGDVFLNANNGWAIADAKTLVKATNVGVNGALNLSNAIWGYKGSPRKFEVSAVAGLGWLHEWETTCNYLTSKTGLDIAFNLGQKKASSIVITPAVLWNLNKTGQIQFNKQFAQLTLSVGYVYHFKTSNKTHAFKVWNVGEMQSEIDRLNEELAKKPKSIEIVKEVQVPVETINSPTITNPLVVQFAKNKAELDGDAKLVLDQIPSGTAVEIVGTASPEGTDAINQPLSQERAEVVANYLTQRGVVVKAITGKGVAQGETTNRLAIVTVLQ